ncbi:M1 family aminopeptidase [Alteromonas oceani]|uniref:M1 family aminopeptidase n=2 Tax=Pseudomonadati TaxID=3379134 RepID=A0ABV7K2A7_9ALTE|nr:M1 family aminopeptidase [Alteromonas oceani]
MLIINEWRLYVRQPLVWLGALGLPGLSVLLVQGLTVADLQLAKRLTMLNITVVMLALPVVVAALTPPLLQRDRLYTMQELVGAARTSQFTRRLNRFVAFLSLVAVICLCGSVLQLLMLSQHPLFDAGVIHTALKNGLFIVAPACFWYCAAALLIAQRVRSALPVYAFFALVWIAYVMLASVTGSPVLAGSSIIHPSLYEAMLVADPLGFTAIFAQFTGDQTDWSVNPSIVLNRLAWLALSALLVWLALSARSVLNESVKRAPGWRLRKTALPDSQSKIPAAITHHPFATLLVSATKALLVNRVMLLVLALYAGAVCSEVLAAIDYAEPHSVITPLSIDALNRVVWDMLPFAGCVLMALWSWQLGWQNQRNGSAEMIAATPVTNTQLVVAQAGALFFAGLVLLGITAIAVAVAQLLSGSQIKVVIYARMLTMTGLPVLLFGWLCLALHHVMRSALMAGGLCLLLLMVKFTPLLSLAGISHPLLDIAGTPLQPADYLIGFSRSEHTFWPYLITWSAVAVCALVLAVNKTHRGAGFALRPWRSLSRSGCLAVGVVVVVLAGFNLALQQERPYMTPDARYALRADYENQYAHWHARVQPVVTHIDALVDFFPQKRRVMLNLTLHLKNRSDEAINEVLVGSYPGFKLEVLTLSGGQLTSHNERLQQFVYQLDSPLLPGQILTLQAAMVVTGARRWLPSGHQILLPEFSYLRGIPLLPNIGFNRQYTLRDEVLREELGLAALDMPLPSSFVDKAPVTTLQSTPATLHSVVSSPASHTVHAQGQVVNQWLAAGRRYMEFATAEPVRNIPVWLATMQTSTTHSVTAGERSVDISLTGLTRDLTSGSETSALQVHLQAVTDTLEWFSAQLTPYPYKQLSLLFTPEFGPSGYALPQVILMSHRLAVRARPATDAGFDQRYRRTAHEAAHQWFGHQIGYGVEADGSFLIESLAKYAELVLIEQRYGKEAMQSLVDYERQRYQHALRGRLTATRAIIDASSSPDVYARATLVFARLRELVGDEPIVSVLKQLLEQNAPGKKSVTSMDFVIRLLASTDAQYHDEIRQLLLGPEVKGLL